MKATNDGPYFLPAGPERGQYYANDYTNWRPLSPQIAPAAAPTVTTGGGGLSAVSMPSSIVANDLLVAFCSTKVNGTHATPAGWTKLKELAQAGIGFPHTFTCFYKVAAGTESGTTPNFSAGAANCAAHVYRIAAANYTGVPTVSTGTTGTISSINPDSISFSGRALVFAAAGYYNASAATGNAYGNATNTFSTDTGVSSDYTGKDIITTEDPNYGGGSMTTWEAMTVTVRAGANAVSADTTITNLIVSPAATPDYIQIELATGAPGAETSIGEHKIVPGDVNNFIPIDLSSGDRISARISGGAAYLSVQLLDKADQG